MEAAPRSDAGKISKHAEESDSSARQESYCYKPLRIKVIESDITSSSFTPGNPFPDTFDETSTDDDHDGDTIDASCFTAGNKVAIQAWFGSYVFTDRSGKTASEPTFRLLKLWRLQAASSSVSNSPVTKRRRIF